MHFRYPSVHATADVKGLKGQQSVLALPQKYVDHGLLTCDVVTPATAGLWTLIAINTCTSDSTYLYHNSTHTLRYFVALP